MRVDKDKLIAEVRELREQIADTCTTELFRRQRGKGAGRGLPHGPVLRRLYKELLALNVFPSRANAIIVKVGQRATFSNAFQTSSSPRPLVQELYS